MGPALDWGLSAEAGEERGIARESLRNILMATGRFEAGRPPVDLGHAAAADQLTHFVPSAEQTGLLSLIVAFRSSGSSEHRFHGGLGDQGGRATPGCLVAGRAALLDDDSHRDGRVLRRREGDEPGVGRRAGCVLAVPVLPATVMPSIWAAVPVPLATTLVIIVVSSGGDIGLIASRVLGSPDSIVVRSGGQHRLHEVGLRDDPLLHACRDHGHLQRRDAHVVPADGGLEPLETFVELGRDRARSDPHRHGELVAEAELRRLLTQNVPAELHMPSQPKAVLQMRSGASVSDTFVVGPACAPTGVRETDRCLRQVEITPAGRCRVELPLERAGCGRQPTRLGRAADRLPAMARLTRRAGRR